MTVATGNRMGAKPKPPAPQFYSLLRQFRESAGISQAGLGRLASVDHSLISRYEDGSRMPHPPTLAALCEALELSTTDRIRFYAAAEQWPFEGVPSQQTARDLVAVMRTAEYREMARDHVER